MVCLGPKRGFSATMFFSKEMRAQLKEENEDMSFGELGAAVGVAWRKLGEVGTPL